jgi:hypothetical protein
MTNAVKWLRVSEHAVEVLLPGAGRQVGVSRDRIVDFNTQYANYLEQSRGPLLTAYHRGQYNVYAADGGYGRIIRTEPYDPKFIIEHSWLCKLTLRATYEAYDTDSHVPLPTRLIPRHGPLMCPTCGKVVYDVELAKCVQPEQFTANDTPTLFLVTCAYGCIRAPDIKQWASLADAAFGDTLAMILKDDPHIDDTRALVEPDSVLLPTSNANSEVLRSVYASPTTGSATTTNTTTTFRIPADYDPFKGGILEGSIFDEEEED